MNAVDPTGRFDWFDVMSADPAGSVAFYSQALGYEPRPGQGMDRTVLGVGRSAVGGVMQLPFEAQERGATLDNGPTQVPSVAQLTDPRGAPFALHSR